MDGETGSAENAASGGRRSLKEVEAGEVKRSQGRNERQQHSTAVCRGRGRARASNRNRNRLGGEAAQAHRRLKLGRRRNVSEEDVVQPAAEGVPALARCFTVAQELPPDWLGRGPIHAQTGLSGHGTSDGETAGGPGTRRRSGAAAAAGALICWCPWP